MYLRHTPRTGPPRESGNGSTPTHIYPDAGTYTATVTALNNVSSAFTTTHVTITDIPISDASATNDSPTQLDQTTTFTASVGTGSNVSYEWDFGDGDSGSGITSTHIYPNTGTYTATVTALNSVSDDVATTTVTITDIPISGLSADNDSPTQVDNETNLTSAVLAGSNVSYEWDFGDGITGTGSIVSHQYPAVGYYTATVTATNTVSTDFITTTVTVKDRISTTMKLMPGWNLVAIDIVPETSFTALSMLQEINLNAGGTCNEVHRWMDSSWDTYVYPSSTNNFSIETGAGYFINCTVGADWEYYGMEMWEEADANLAAGWNLISIPYPPDAYTAQPLLDHYNSHGNVCTEIDRWHNNGWDAHLDGLPFNDFVIATDMGYFVYCSSVAD